MERTADVIDAATDLAEREREEAARRRKPVMKATGHCRYCNTATPGVFCDPECERDYTQEQWAKAQRPR